LSTQPFFNYLHSRRSIRRFLPDPISEEVLWRVLEAATRSPSAHNRQPWRFTVLATQESRRRLADEMGLDFRNDLLSDGRSFDDVDRQVEKSRSRIIEAPAAVLLNLDLSEMDLYNDEKRQTAEYLMAVQSVAMAGGYLLLAAHAEGLGGVWICAPLFAKETVKRALLLPEEWEPQGLILLGFPAKVPASRPRRPLNEVVQLL
jgi:coenzyme F420-0:L-glutamate ligase / coenzyme F420-1:gamma-L-glutamate ligase